MSNQLGTKGGQLDLLIRQGATQGPYNMQLFEADATPLDITGGTLRAEIRRTPESPKLTGVTFTFTINDAANGDVTWEIPATSTELLDAGEDDETEEESKYVWDMELELASGRVIPLCYGVVKVFREVTKDN